ncbi:MAG: cupin domain-containing protein [Anaerolineae bacterium]
MLQVHHFQEIESQETEYGEGVTVRWVIGEDHGAPHFAMRIFDVQPGQATGFHSHWWEHEVFVLAGTGSVKTKDKQQPIREGTVVFVPGGMDHQFINEGDDLLRFICCVPLPWLEGLAEKHGGM